MMTIPCRKCGSTQIQKKWAYESWRPEIPLPDVRRLWYASPPSRFPWQAGGLGGSSRPRTCLTAGDRSYHWLQSQYGYRDHKKNVIRPLAETITPLRARPILEMDELWSYVDAKAQKVWIGLVLERQTRRIVGIAFGDRSDETCRALWWSLPPDYRKRAILSTAYWESYAHVLPSKRLRQVSKQSGETAHIERFNHTLRQRCATLVRKTLSFSKKCCFHELRIRLFIDYYNATLPV